VASLAINLVHLPVSCTCMRCATCLHVSAVIGRLLHPHFDPFGVPKAFQMFSKPVHLQPLTEFTAACIAQPIYGAMCQVCVCRLLHRYACTASVLLPILLLLIVLQIRCCGGSIAWKRSLCAHLHVNIAVHSSVRWTVTMIVVQMQVTFWLVHFVRSWECNGKANA
jgi:hypothetical protein